jgi:F-type H+-transporting ATPase subunit b
MHPKLTLTISRYCIMAVVTLMPLAAYAATPHGEDAGFWSLRFFWLNFLVYVTALFFLTRKPFMKMWGSRREEIRSAIEAAKDESASARAQLAEAQSRLAGVNREIEKLSSDIAAEGQREAGDVLTSARQRAERIAQQAKDLSEAERKATEASIRRELVNLAVQRAEEKLRQSINPGSDKPLRDVALSGVRELVQ